LKLIAYQQILKGFETKGVTEISSYATITGSASIAYDFLWLVGKDDETARATESVKKANGCHSGII
jgi:hypothetical protein